MNRRTFLRVFATAAVGAVVAPHLPAIEFAPPQTFNSACELSSSPLTFEMLREAIERISNASHNHPKLLIVSPRVYQSYSRMMGLVFDADVAA